MSRFEEYSQRYKNIAMKREDGILEVRFHTEGGPLVWSFEAHADTEQAFLDINRDRDNEIVIITGTGDRFSGPQGKPGTHFLLGSTPEEYDRIFWESKHLTNNILNIDVPVISAINGPAFRHPEIPLLSDIVIASDTTLIQDSAHFQGGLVPGDGVQVLFPLLMGYNRGRYFLLTGEIVDAKRALELGMVNEVLPPDQVLPRAYELARKLMQQSRLMRRYSRQILVRRLKLDMADILELGIAIEGLALMEEKSA